MSVPIIREITPLTPPDCFTLFSRHKTNFDFPLHFHPEYELNLIVNAAGAKRIVGDHIGEIEDVELVFVGPNLNHGWFDHKCTSGAIEEITIQFHEDLFGEQFLSRNQLSFVRTMFQRSKKGILFSRDTATKMIERLRILVRKSGFDSVLELMSILHDLSISRHMLTLSNNNQDTEPITYNSRRLEKVFAYLNENYHRHITLTEVAQLISMPEISFSRFIKKRTGKTFVDSLNDIRLGHAARMLIDTTNTIAEIAYNCGFNNMSNFNRAFKRKKNATPKDFRENYSGTRVFI